MNNFVLTASQMVMVFKFTAILYSMNKTHILNNLIIIEFMAVASTFIMISFINMLNMELYMILFMMVMLITESVLGLSILINIIRTHSNDYLKSTNAISL